MARLTSMPSRAEFERLLIGTPVTNAAWRRPGTNLRWFSTIPAPTWHTGFSAHPIKRDRLHGQDKECIGACNAAGCSQTG